MGSKRLLLVLTLLLGGGCALPVEQAIDRNICSKLDLPVDLQPRKADKIMSLAGDETQPGFANNSGELVLAAGQQKTDQQEPKDKIRTLLSRIVVPKEIPGGDAPEYKRGAPGAPGTEAEVDRHFPPLEPLAKVLEAAPGPDGRPLTLADLQKLALVNNPVLKQMTADVEVARGGALQARQYPNPFVGFTGQSQAPNGGPFFGGTVQQTIKTANKLSYSYAAAYKDVEAADLHLRQAESDLRSQVRSGYFGVLVARESLIVNHALARLTDEVFKVMTEQLKGGVAAPYETMALRLIANQTRLAYVQSYHTYVQSWKQLTATLGLTGMPLTQLAGNAKYLPIPKFEHDKVLAIILNHHTDVLVAQVGLEKAEKALRLAQVTPIPDIQTSLSVIPDYTPGFGIGPFRTFAMAQVGVNLPLWDRNQGNIRQAQGQLARAKEEPHHVRCDLTARLAEAFNRYEYNRKFISMYGKMLQDQVTAFRLVVRRYAKGDVGGVQYLDLITAEQNLFTLEQAYLGTLRDMWTAVVDVASLLQTPDLFQTGQTYPVPVIPDLNMLFELPCFHPCLPTDRKLYGADGDWPLYGPGEKAEGAPEPRPLPEMKQGQSDPGTPALGAPVTMAPEIGDAARKP